MVKTDIRISLLRSHYGFPRGCPHNSSTRVHERRWLSNILEFVREYVDESWNPPQFWGAAVLMRRDATPRPRVVDSHIFPRNA